MQKFLYKTEKEKEKCGKRISVNYVGVFLNYVKRFLQKIQDVIGSVSGHQIETSPSIYKN